VSCQIQATQALRNEDADAMEGLRDHCTFTGSTLDPERAPLEGLVEQL
jgi:hypothetical protein